MMAMMEKYANNLEALVDERTDQLTEEKKKTGRASNVPKVWTNLISLAIAFPFNYIKLSFAFQTRCFMKCYHGTLPSN